MDWWEMMMMFAFDGPIGIGLIFAPLLIYLAVCELAACFRRWRSVRAAERILDSVPDVPYLPLPDQQAGGSGGVGPSSSCVICIAEYARGEGRFVMPGCVHAFHRGCIGEWLRQGNTTCPICRATAIVVASLAAREKDDAVSTAEDMV